MSVETRSSLPPSSNRTSAYGWVIVVLAALAMIATLPGRTHGLGMITERLLSDSSLGLDRQLFGHVNLWATLIGALFCLPCGWMIDRIGLRTSLTVVVALLGLVVLAMTKASGLLQFAILITLTRGLGQSALSVISISMIGKWFRAKLPLATGVYSVLVSVGFIQAFQWGGSQMNLPWRSQWQTLGWLLLVALAPVFLVLVQPSPAEQESHSENQADANTHDFTFSEALSTSAFWLLGLSSALFLFVSSGVSLFGESLLIERGFEKADYYNLMKMNSAVGLAANLTTGIVTTRFRMTRVTGVAMALMAAALLGFPFVKTQLQLVAYAVVMGCAGGMVTVLFFAAFARLFGRTHLGRIQGVAQMLTVIASGLGPVILAEVKSQTGSYLPALQGVGLVAATLAVLVAIVPLPRPLTISPSFDASVEPVTGG